MQVKSNSQKPWAYLVRESTAGQRELSPESQLEWISDMEEEYGCHVPKERIINITWASQELLECPDIKHKLIPWIDNEEIGGLGMLHSDRLWCSPGESARPYSQLRFQIQCRRQSRKIATVADQGRFLLTHAGARFIQSQGDIGGKHGFQTHHERHKAPVGKKYLNPGLSMVKEPRPGR